MDFNFIRMGIVKYEALMGAVTHATNVVKHIVWLFFV